MSLSLARARAVLRRVLAAGRGGAALCALWQAVLPASAAADQAQAWLSTEARIPVAPEGSLPPTSVRLASQVRLRPDSPAVDTLAVRIGPLWELGEWLRAGAHLEARAALEEGRLREEFYVDVEPTLRTRWGAVELAMRQRLELLLHPAGQAWYRNRLQARLRPEDMPWRPFASYELFWRLGGGRVNEHRARLGMGFDLPHAVRLDAGYQLRVVSPERAGWQVTHVLLLNVLFAPEEQLRGGD